MILVPSPQIITKLTEMASDKNLGWALKNGDLDRVKEIIEGDVSPKF